MHALISKSARFSVLWLICWFSCPGTGETANEPLANPRPNDAGQEQFAALAKRLDARNYSFDRIFMELCRLALTNAETNATIPIEDQVRSLWGGLWLWTKRGGHPVFQAGGHEARQLVPGAKVDHGYSELKTLDEHYALHFIGGGMFEAYFDVGRRAGVTKERIDVDRADDYFDYNKVAVVTMGARWVDVALAGDAQQTRRWLELWASGQYTLSKSLPKLRWGHLPPGVVPPPEKVKEVMQEVSAAIEMPKRIDPPDQTKQP